MPKANEGKTTKVTAEADPKSLETKAAAQEKKAEPEEKKAETTEKKAEPIENKPETEKAAPAAKAAKTAKKTTAKKTAAKKAEKRETVYIQCAGQEFELASIMEKVKAATKSLRAVKEISIYVKPEENRAYYVAKKTKGEEVGSVEI